MDIVRKYAPQVKEVFINAISFYELALGKRGFIELKIGKETLKLERGDFIDLWGSFYSFLLERIAKIEKLKLDANSLIEEKKQEQEKEPPREEMKIEEEKQEEEEKEERKERGTLLGEILRNEVQKSVEEIQKAVEETLMETSKELQDLREELRKLREENAILREELRDLREENKRLLERIELYGKMEERLDKRIQEKEAELQEKKKKVGFLGRVLNIFKGVIDFLKNKFFGRRKER